MATLVAAEETTNGLLPSMGGENYEFAIPDVPEVRKFKDIHTSWLLAFYDRLNIFQYWYHHCSQESQRSAIPVTCPPWAVYLS